MKERDVLAILCVLGAVTFPAWIVPAVVWMIATRRTPASCNREANGMTEATA